jgi:hypothetical protein
MTERERKIERKRERWTDTEKIKKETDKTYY